MPRVASAGIAKRNQCMLSFAHLPSMNGKAAVHPPQRAFNPSTLLASRRVDFPNQATTLQTSKTSNKPTRGRVYPPPTPSLPVRLALVQVGPRVLRPTQLEAVLASSPPALTSHNML